MTTILTPPEAISAGTRRSAPAKAMKRNGSSSGGEGASHAIEAGHLEELLIALQSARHGDFSVRLPTRRAGLIGRIAAEFNALIETNAKMTKELGRVARAVGRDGRLGERVVLPAATGGWAQDVESVNGMIDSLARPTTEVARVIAAVAEGDLSQKMALRIGDQPVRGEFLRIGRVVNAMVDQLGSFSSEVSRVAREVGTEGKLGGQAEVKGVSGTWKDLTENVNQLAGNLTNQVRNIAQVTTAVAEGDLSQKITVEAKGEVAALADTINLMVDQLRSFAAEVTRVAQDVGTEGRLGGQARVPGVSGTWKDLTDSVNFMAGNLTTQVRNIAQVTTAVARGDLTQKITVEAKGEVAALADTINSMTDTLRLFAEQVTSVAREVGTEGRLGGQAEVPGVAGTWKDLTDSVNFMASNLTAQVRDIAQVTTAVAKGDLSQKITVDVRGEVLELKDTINTMVDQLSAFADEVTRVAREVGTEGELGGQAEVPGVSGTWKDLTDSVNVMAGNLTTQVRGIVKVVTAVAEGDLSQKFVLEAKGEVAALADTINSMTDTLRSFASEVTRVAREVGTEGELGGQADVPGVAGTWKDLTDSVNSMASNLTGQVRNIAQVTTAVANGDLSQKIGVEAKGEVAALADTINRMVDQLRSFAAEVTRVAQEVGTEGRLGGQARVPDVAGTWKDLTDSVNFMASNLTGQVRNIAQVTTAVAKGDLTQKITVDVRGEVLELKNTINTMVDQLGSFADEVTRVAREVGTEGRLGGQAEVRGVSGTWKNLTDSVNSMAGNLTGQVRNIAQVTTAVANGDLTQKITVDVKGEVLELKDTINTMVDQLSAFADEVTRVAREVGTEGRLGGQAQVQGVSGTWRDLTENVNQLAGNLTDQVRNIAQVTTAVAQGDLSQKITVDARGEVAALRDTINNMVDQLRSFAAEVTRVAREVGTEGKLGGQAEVEGVSGTWKGLTENVNQLAGNLTDQVRNIAQVTTAVARGDLTQKITVEARGEVAALKNTINTMVDQLSAFADEVTRVAREVGTEGRLGGQAQVQGVSGTWRDLTENVNFMAGNLTDQVRNIAQVTTAVARGELNKKITVDARGEILELKNTINTMVDQLSSFAAEVTRVGKEVGTEGKLGGQAEVEGVSGTWKGLTDNVNTLASTLTTQLRAIAEVSTAVTQGDLSRQIAVEAQGEVAELKDNINQMIANLRETTQKNAEQDWLKTNLARISGLMQGQRDLRTVSRLIMSELTPVVSAQLGAFFLASPEETPGGPVFNLLAAYGYRRRDGLAMSFAAGEGLVGQAAVERKSILITEAPADYIRIGSGLGEAAPVNIIVIPVLFEDEVRAVIELASFQPFSEVHLTFLDQLRETIGVVLNTIIANMRTEELLEQSQSYARLLEEQNRDIEVKNREIELAQVALQERAEQLALSSKYKSEFLANMSHELRTPLNSLLILAKLLAEDPNNTLTPKQVEYAQTIHASGSDLLSLISDILDLSKVEAGKMDLLPAQTAIGKVVVGIDQEFRPVADQKGLTFECEVLAGTPESVVTDEQRLQQVLRNLLSNALKFTERGTVRLRVGPAPAGMSFSEPTLRSSPGVLAFSVSDTGIGVPDDKLRLIFEAFQQADGTTSRRYGGTGLGLNISREIAHLLGGEIRVESKVGAGSVFTLYIPGQPAEAKAAPLALVGSESNDVLEGPAAATSPSLPVVLFVGLPAARIDLGTAAVEVEEVTTAAEAVAALERGPVDCVVVDVSNASADGLALLERVQKDPSYHDLPFVVHAQRTLNKREEARLSRYAESIQVHRSSEASEVAREVSAALHVRAGRRDAAEAEFQMATTPELAGRRVLIIDDDVRNVFALTSALEASGMEVLFAENGRDGLRVLEANPEVELVLLDIMMPEMDGYETAAAIRVQPQFGSLPIIVLTAKAMIGDRERAVEAGASDYITKPVDLPHLLSVMHGWLNR